MRVRFPDAAPFWRIGAGLLWLAATVGFAQQSPAPAGTGGAADPFAMDLDSPLNTKVDAAGVATVLEQAEVVKGPGSVPYGSNAAGKDFHARAAGGFAGASYRSASGGTFSVSEAYQGDVVGYPSLNPTAGAFDSIGAQARYDRSTTIRGRTVFWGAEIREKQNR